VCSEGLAAGQRSSQGVGQSTLLCEEDTWRADRNWRGFRNGWRVTIPGGHGSHRGSAEGVRQTGRGSVGPSGRRRQERTQRLKYAARRTWATSGPAS
jgi:hypothetical protein